MDRFPRLEYRDRDGAHCFVDRHGATWQILSFAGGDGWPIERCAVGRGNRWTQYRLFVLLPNALVGRLYRFSRGERRGVVAYDVGRIDAQWARSAVDELPIAPLHLRSRP